MLTVTVKRRKENGQRIAWSDFSLDFERRTHVMGILNVTPDSFSDGGQFMSEESAVSQALNMSRDGADIIDVGGESTRPGAMHVKADEEIKRVVPVIKRLKVLINIPISIDTSKASVAEAALASGASMVNDITGLRGDPGMADVIAKYDVPVVIMHIKGTPRTMQADPYYEDLIGDITGNLVRSIEIAKEAGIDEGKIIVDPGIGFGKTMEHNLRIIKELRRFKVLGLPIMVGLSRKSFIGQVLGSPVNERLIGTTAGLALAISNGANIVRVHDVKEALEVTRMADSICRV